MLSRIAYDLKSCRLRRINGNGRGLDDEVDAHSGRKPEVHRGGRCDICGQGAGVDTDLVTMGFQVCDGDGE